MVSKKGDLSLSTNAIVILILAITILGLGLTFVRGLFKQAESKITEVTSATEIANPPTRDNPMTLSPSQLSLRQTERKKVTLAFMNYIRGNIACRLFVLRPGDKKEVMGETDAVLISGSSYKFEKFAIYNNPGKAWIARDRISTWTIALDGSKLLKQNPAGAFDPTTGTHVLTATMCCANEEDELEDLVIYPGEAYTCTGTDKYQVTRDIIVTVTS